MINRTIADLIGNTPLIKLQRVVKEGSADVYVKIESTNPGGSVKDRIGLAMIVDAEKSGKLTAGGTIVEATSGNTGIALALVAASRGYRCILTMPETMSIERRQLLALYGAEVVLTAGSEAMTGAINKALEIQIPKARLCLNSLKIQPIQKCIDKPPPKKFGRQPKARLMRLSVV
jgi:cysteine synthase A